MSDLVLASVLGWTIRVVITVLGVLVIYLIGAGTLRKFKVPPPAEPDPDLVIPVDLRFRCIVCGTEVTMTSTQADIDIEAPRHCREDMVLVTPVE
jgi:hypothetical protein